MNDEIYVKMLTKYFKGVANINGILCHPLGVFDARMGADILKFRMENPDDLSYTKPGLESQLGDQVDLFNRLAGMGQHSRFTVKIEGAKDIYTSNDVNDYVKSVLSNIKKLKTNIYDDEETQEKVYDIILVNHKDVEYELDGDFVMILNKVEPIKAYTYSVEDDSLVGEISLDDVISGYGWWQDHYRYDETEINYPEFDSFFSGDNAPNYVDAEFQAPYVVTIFQ